MTTLTNTFITLAVVPAALMTGTPTWGVSKSAAQGMSVSKTEALLRGAPLRTEFEIKAVGTGPLDRIEMLRDRAKEYATFVNGWDGDGSLQPTEESLQAALSFIDKLPGGLPLPGVMVSALGEIGFYWDLNGGYADISFAESGRGSFFSRTTAGSERFQQGLDPEVLERGWFFAELGAMAAPTEHAA